MTKPRQTITMKAVQVVQTAQTPFPKWVSVVGLVLVNLGTFGHDPIVVTFGGGSFGEWAANAIPVIGAILSTLSHSLAGDGGRAPAEDVR